jgi:hypothetical protein
MPQSQTHTHHGRSKTLTISGEKKVLRTGKKQLLNAYLHSLASNHCENSREAKKKNPPKKKHKLCAEIPCGEKRKRREKIDEVQRFSEGSSAFGSPHVSVPDFASSFPFRRRVAREKVGSISTVKTSTNPRLRT